ncbi:MAG: class I SAM-dependent methyltransferase [Gemmatimonadetes bacterium]|nr:class I SAM-dependent methyltransferase [Gemmatimonadota bacterium]MBI2401642.1 class I SAM-dependent methyltransferase [Gemmatimonadota bacterium]
MPPEPGLSPAGPESRQRRFREAYGAHRAREGRGLPAEWLPRLPHLDEGPQASQWRIRACTFRCFVARVVRPMARALASQPLTIVDLGAGNGWLCYRLTRLGHRATAIDLRTDPVDGLGAAAGYAPHLPQLFWRLAASFETLPLAPGSVDLAVFNASLHYALDLTEVLGEAARVLKPSGRIAVLDSPFYPTMEAGEAMVREKRALGRECFGDLAEDLLALPCIEYLTPARLAEASRALGLTWRRHRPRYPLAYRVRPWVARLRGRRAPSRFDVWEARFATR